MAQYGDRIHDHNNLFEMELTQMGSIVLAEVNGRIMKGETYDDLIEPMTEADKKLLDDGLRALADRIKPGPGPDIPDSMWKDACAANFDKNPEGFDAFLEQIKDGTFPGEVFDVLVEDSDCDRHPEELMLTLGEYIYRTYSEEEILKYQLVFHDEWHTKGKSSAETLSALIYNIILEAGECTQYHYLKHVAELVKNLKIQRLRSAASKVELDSSGGKPALVVRLVEFMYSDVLLPPGLKDQQTLAEESLIRSLDKENVKKSLQTAHMLGRATLKSACFSIIREHPVELLADPEIIAIIKEENDEFWDKLIDGAGGSAARKEKRKRGDSNSE